MVRGVDHSAERPSAVKHAVSIIDSKFSGYGQHDSHEFGRVLETRYSGDRVQVDAEIPESLQRRLDNKG